MLPRFLKQLMNAASRMRKAYVPGANPVNTFDACQVLPPLIEKPKVPLPPTGLPKVIVPSAAPKQVTLVLAIVAFS